MTVADVVVPLAALGFGSMLLGAFLERDRFFDYGAILLWLAAAIVMLNYITTTTSPSWQ